MPRLKGDISYREMGNLESWLMNNRSQFEIYETKNKIAHVPTLAEKKRQAEVDEMRSRYNSRSTGKVYPSWEYLPSGRLYWRFQIRNKHDGWQIPLSADGAIGLLNGWKTI